MKVRRGVVCILFMILLAATLLAPANAQFIQQGPKLTGTNGFGFSGGISADGNTAAPVMGPLYTFALTVHGASRVPNWQGRVDITAKPSPFPATETPSWWDS